MLTCFVFSINPYDVCPSYCISILTTKVMIDDDCRAIVQMASVSALFPVDTGNLCDAPTCEYGKPATALMGIGFSGYRVADADLV